MVKYMQLFIRSDSLRLWQDFFSLMQRMLRIIQRHFIKSGYFVSLCDTSNTLHWSDFTPTCDPVTELDLITELDIFTHLRKLSKEHLLWVWHANRGRVLLRTSGANPLLDIHVFYCWNQPLLNLFVFRAASVLFFYFICMRTVTS